jgi:hypothetical protein
MSPRFIEIIGRLDLDSQPVLVLVQLERAGAVAPEHVVRIVVEQRADVGLADGFPKRARGDPLAEQARHDLGPLVEHRGVPANQRRLVVALLA